MDNPQRNNDIRESYRRHGGNLSKVAKELNLTLNACRQAFPTTPVVMVKPFDDDVLQPDRNTLGRPHLREFIVSVRHCHTNWPEEDRAALQKARQHFDAGTHQMVQGRDGQWIIQYCWPKTQPTTPDPYFYGVFS